MNVATNPDPAFVSSDVIEKRARYLQLEVWNLRRRLWPGVVPEDPVEILEPGVALRLRGYDVRNAHDLGEYNEQGRRIAVGGTIHNGSRVVEISTRLSPTAKRFTLAHELGHAELHTWQEVLHRDLPLDGPAPRSKMEIEADRYASAFLMPAALVRARFERSFGCKVFRLTDDTAFALCCARLEVVLSKCPTLRHLALLIASAPSYAGMPVLAIATQFKVSAKTMAIRLEELGLVAS